MSDIKQPIDTQPQAAAPMQVAGGNRNVNNCAIGPDGKRDWSYGLFDCFSTCGLCCWATWCPCVVFSKNKQRLQSLQAQGTPLASGGETYDSNCFIYGALDITGYSWIMQLRTREEARQRYNIRGDTFSDCFSSWCCRPCALTQERRELELEENSFQGK